MTKWRDAGYKIIIKAQNFIGIWGPFIEGSEMFSHAKAVSKSQTL